MMESARTNRWVRLAPLLMVFALIGGIVAPRVYAQEGSSTRLAFDPLAPPSGVTAKAVYVEDASSDTTLYSFNSDERRSPASTTKLMTALVIANNTTDWQDLVTVDASDVLSPEDGESMVGLLDGDVLTVEQMMYGLMLPSGNDAAHAMARFIGGKLLAQDGGTGDPVDRFIQEMNNTVTTLGLQNTHFTNAAGLYDQDHYTTAHDLAVIASHSYAVPEVATASGSATYTFTTQGANPREITIANTNKLLGEDGVIAGKTGTLTQSLACLVIMRKESGNMVIGVVLGSDIEFDADQVQIADTDHRFSDMSAILGDMSGQFRWVQPGDADFPGLTQEMAVWNVKLGDSNAVVLPAADSSSLRYLLQLGPPAQPDTPVGSLLIFSGDQVVAEKQIVQAEAS